jgi:hypothetical protein
MCCSLTAQKLINNSLTSLNANPIIFINYHLPVNEPYISANHFHQQHLLTMLRTKKKVLKDGAVISPPPTPPTPITQPIHCRRLRHLLHCRPGGCHHHKCTHVTRQNHRYALVRHCYWHKCRHCSSHSKIIICSQGQGHKHHQQCPSVDNTPHDNAFMGDPTFVAKHCSRNIIVICIRACCRTYPIELIHGNCPGMCARGCTPNARPHRHRYISWSMSSRWVPVSWLTCKQETGKTFPFQVW